MTTIASEPRHTMCEFVEFLAVEAPGREEWALSQAMTTNTLQIIGYYSKDWTNYCKLPLIITSLPPPSQLLADLPVKQENTYVLQVPLQMN